MVKLIVHLSLGLLVAFLAITSCDGFGGTGNIRYRSRENKENAQPYSLIGSEIAVPNEPYIRGLGLSAWGIVTVVVFLILAIMGMYYFSICYPIICQKNRKYDTMGLPSVA